jgi:hypothetical protein
MATGNIRLRMPAHAISTEDGLKDAARTTLRELLKLAKRYKRRRERLEALFLFEVRKRKVGRNEQTGSKATVGWEDTPETELMLKHRDDYERLSALLESARVAIEKATVDPEDGLTLLKLMQTVSTLERQREAHLESIREILGQLSRELMAQEAVMMKVVAEAARLAQLAEINQLRINAAMQARGMGHETRSTGELEKLARDLQGRIARGEVIDAVSEPNE